MLKLQQELVKLQSDIVKMKEKNQNKRMGYESKCKVCTYKNKDEIERLRELGQTFVINVKFPYKGTKHFKYAIINYNKKVRESNYKNNIYKIGKIGKI